MFRQCKIRYINTVHCKINESTKMITFNNCKFATYDIKSILKWICNIFTQLCSIYFYLPEFDANIAELVPKCIADAKPSFIKIECDSKNIQKLVDFNELETFIVRKLQVDLRSAPANFCETLCKCEHMEAINICSLKPSILCLRNALINYKTLRHLEL